MLAWFESPMHESVGIEISFEDPLPTVAPSLPTAKLGASLPSATVVNFKTTCDNDPGTGGAALAGGLPEEPP